MQDRRHLFTRRTFVRTGTLALSATAIAAPETAKPLFSAMGIAAPLDQATALKEQGADFLTLGTADLLCPDQPDAVFEQKLADLAKSPLPVLACNGFIRPANLRCTGADANHDDILAWSRITFRRMKMAGGKFIVFGSGASRALRDGWTKQQADPQFVSLLERMAPLAAEQGITVVVEQLRASECNYINRIGEAAELIRRANHPNIRLLADLYHMAEMGDTPADLKAAMDLVVHVEIAEKKTRTYPGVNGDDFRPYFRVLREAGYHGAINIEGTGDFALAGSAFREIAKQAAGA